MPLNFSPRTERVVAPKCPERQRQIARVLLVAYSQSKWRGEVHINVYRFGQARLHPEEFRQSRESQNYILWLT